MLDIVDEHDCVIGSESRGEIHRKGLKHRSIHVIVLDGDGHVLLQKRSQQKDQCAGMWDTSCAGHVESGQTYQESVPRELEEELGIVSESPLQELFKMPPTPDNGHEFAVVYAMQHKGPFSAAEDEIDELRWYSFTAVDAWVERLAGAEGGDHQDLTSGFMEIWRRFRQ